MGDLGLRSDVRIRPRRTRRANADRQFASGICREVMRPRNTARLDWRRRVAPPTTSPAGTGPVITRTGTTKGAHGGCAEPGKCELLRASIGTGIQPADDVGDAVISLLQDDRLARCFTRANSWGKVRLAGGRRSVIRDLTIVPACVDSRHAVRPGKHGAFDACLLRSRSSVHGQQIQRARTSSHRLAIDCLTPSIVPRCNLSVQNKCSNEKIEHVLHVVPSTGRIQSIVVEAGLGRQFTLREKRSTSARRNAPRCRGGTSSLAFARRTPTHANRLTGRVASLREEAPTAEAWPRSIRGDPRSTCLGLRQPSRCEPPDTVTCQQTGFAYAAREAFVAKVVVSGLVLLDGGLPATGREPGCGHQVPSVLRPPSRLVCRVLGRLQLDAICFTPMPAREFR
jgi:hypothetical protein